MKLLAISSLLLSAATSLVIPRTTNSTVALRVLPLGDSITWGFVSGPTQNGNFGNGYREQLYNQLNKTFTSLDFIGDGAVRRGNMSDPDNAGYSGYRIEQIAAVAKTAALYQRQPNVVLVHAGTNDLFRDPPALPYAQAPARLEILVSDIATAIPQVTIFLAKIVQAVPPASNARIAAFNAEVDGVAERVGASGAKVVVVDHSGIDDLPDTIHPSDAAYRTMGDTWYQAIVEANAAGLITAPNAPVTGR